MITHYKTHGWTVAWCGVTRISVEKGDCISTDIIDCTCTHCLKALQQTVNGRLKRFEVYAE